MIADAKLTGSLPQGIAVAHYMLDPDAKQKDPDIKKLQPQHDIERILLIQTDHARPVLMLNSPKEAAKEFIQGITLWNNNNRPGKKPPKSHWEHRVISFHPQDSAKLDAHSACEIARESLHMVASGNRPTLLVVHGDTRHMHVHMLYATVNEKGRIHNPHGDFRLWEHAMEELEIKHALYKVEKRLACSDNDPSRLPDGSNPTKQEFRMIQRTEQPSCKQQLRELIREAIDDCQSLPPSKQFPHFLSSLKSKKIGVSANIQSAGRVAGLRFHYGIFSKHGIKASALGHQFGWGRLSKSVKFGKNSSFNTQLLKLSDHRVKQWIKHSSGGKKWASTIMSPNYKAQKSSGRLNKTETSSSSNSAPACSPLFPVEYPNWLKEFIRAIINAANAEIGRQQMRNSEMERSIKICLELLEAIQKRGIQKFLRTHQVLEGSQHGDDIVNIPSSQGSHTG